MKVPSQKELLNSPLFAVGLIFLAINLTTSHIFYEVSDYKTLLALAGAAFLVVWYDIIHREKDSGEEPWEMWLILSLLPLATIPGYFVQAGHYNYFLFMEFSITLAVIVYAGYIYRNIKEMNDISPLIFLIGITVIYVSLWGLIENILVSNGFARIFFQNRVQSTFGNPNYFAGFLNLLLPIFFALFLGSLSLAKTNNVHIKLKFDRNNGFWLAVLFFGLMGLSLTGTRAAIAGCFIGIMFSGFLYSLYVLAKRERRSVFKITSVALIVLVLTAIIFSLIANINIEHNRFAKLLNIETWTPRLIPWKAAVDSISASPLFGYGLGSSHQLYQEFVDPSVRIYVSSVAYGHVHSEILEYMQEAGFFGLVTYLFVWGYIIAKLVKVLRSSKHNAGVRILAIGISGGFLGYHIQSLASLVPRMMVVKLPLFMMISIVFTLKRLSVNDVSRQKTAVQTGKSAVALTSIVMVTVACFTFFPWVVTQYRYQAAIEMRSISSQIEELSNSVAIKPDINSLNMLAKLLVVTRDVEKLEKTVAIIDQRVPGMRNLGFIKASLAFIEGDLEKSKRLALEFQEKDNFFDPSMDLLFHLAVDTGDADLFYREMNTLVRKHLLKNRLLAPRSPILFKTSEGGYASRVVFEQSSDEMIVIWDKAFVERLFQKARRNWLEKIDASLEKEETFVELWTSISDNEYFKLAVKETAGEKELAVIREVEERYFEKNRAREQKLKYLEMAFENSMSNGKDDDEAFIREKYRQDIRKVNIQFADDLESYEKYLSERTDWPIYKAKVKFINSFVLELVAHVHMGSSFYPVVGYTSP
ncbi:MAG: O-antigen ligase family protein [Nitrospinota bacterium]|nr:O-antigen ligase family protein [Nitrospinota bacterium]